jgi:hypothetical protein
LARVKDSAVRKLMILGLVAILAVLVFGGYASGTFSHGPTLTRAEQTHINQYLKQQNLARNQASYQSVYVTFYRQIFNDKTTPASEIVAHGRDWCATITQAEATQLNRAAYSSAHPATGVIDFAKLSDATAAVWAFCRSKATFPHGG